MVKPLRSVDCGPRPTTLKGDDSGAPLDIDTRDIAAKFVELYWRQCRPFLLSQETSGLILQQNTGKQAAIISKVADLQQACDGAMFRLRQGSPERWSALVTEVDQVVRVMPLWKLQTVGAERLDFLYQNLDRGSRITLKPGVAYCFRNFYELLRDLIEGAWVRFVQKLNADRLGSLSDLGTFLFGQARSSLDAYRSILFDVQKECASTAGSRFSGKRTWTISSPGHAILPTWVTTLSSPTLNATATSPTSWRLKGTLRRGLSVTPRAEMN